MLKKRILMFLLCGLLALALTACSDNKAQSTVSNAASKLESDVSDGVSDLESKMDDGASRLESGGNLDSDLADDGVGNDSDGSRLGDGEYGETSSEDLSSASGSLADGGDSLDESSGASTKER